MSNKKPKDEVISLLDSLFDQITNELVGGNTYTMLIRNKAKIAFGNWLIIHAQRFLQEGRGAKGILYSTMVNNYLFYIFNEHKEHLIGKRELMFIDKHLCIIENQNLRLIKDYISKEEIFEGMALSEKELVESIKAKILFQRIAESNYR